MKHLYEFNFFKTKEITKILKELFKSDIDMSKIEIVEQYFNKPIYQYLYNDKIYKIIFYRFLHREGGDTDQAFLWIDDEEIDIEDYSICQAEFLYKKLDLLYKNFHNVTDKYNL